jgi:hypothetical protein
LVIIPALQTNSRFQGSKVAMLSGKVLRFCMVPRFQSCRFPGLQGCKFRNFQRSRILDYQCSGFQVSSVESSKDQGSTLTRSYKGLGNLIYHQRNDKRTAKQMLKQKRAASVDFKNTLWSIWSTKRQLCSSQSARFNVFHKAFTFQQG